MHMYYVVLSECMYELQLFYSHVDIEDDEFLHVNSAVVNVDEVWSCLCV